MRKVCMYIFICSVNTITPFLSKPIKLEQKFLVHADGKFIKADLVEQMLQLQKDLHIILFGNIKKTINSLGIYMYNDKPYSLAGLVALTPKSAQDQAELRACFIKAKAEFVQVGAGLHQTSIVHKMFMEKLIRESCEKRKRLNSRLIVYAQSTNDKEFLDTKITDIHELYTFIADLHNFLSDLVFSIPNAYNMHLERMQKIEKVNSLCENIPALKNNITLRVKFLAFIKEKELHKLKDNNFTQEHIASLFRKFSRS